MNVTGKKQSTARRLIAYGYSGLGKTSFASEFPNPVFLQTEDGLGSSEAMRFPVAKTYAEIKANLKELMTEKHDFKTVALDSLDWLEPLIFTEVCKINRLKNVEEAGYGKGYVLALEYWSEILKGLDFLYKKGINIVLISHATIEKFDDPTAPSYDRYNLKINKKASALVKEWADEVLFITYAINTNMVKGQKVKAMGSGDRVIRCQERPAFSAKNRLNMPESIPYIRGQGYTEYAKYFGGEGEKVTIETINENETEIKTNELGDNENGII